LGGVKNAGISVFYNDHLQLYIRKKAAVNVTANK